jgi:CrcB protein
MPFLWISLGAVAGANARYLVGLWAADRFEGLFPYGTLIINVTGSLLLGLIVGVLAERSIENSAWRLMLAVGFCGSYTTFSTYSLEAVNLFRLGAPVQAIVYIVGSAALAMVAVVAGLALARLV